MRRYRLPLSTLLVLAACSSDPVTPGESTVPVLTAIMPDSLVEAQSATLTGRGFSAVAATNRVTVDGVAATVTAASATSLTITVPRTECRPARRVEVSVAVGRSRSDAREHPIRPAAYVDLPVGRQLIVRDPSEFCLHFAESAAEEAYLVGVQSVAERVNSLTPVTVAAVAPPGAEAATPLASVPPAMRRGGFRGADPLLEAPQAVRWRRHFAAEARLREREDEIFGERIRKSGARLEPPAAQALAGSPLVPGTVRVGDTVRIQIPNFYTGGAVAVTAVVRVVGGKGIWLEDVENPAGGYTMADLQALSDLFDGRIYASDVETFGEPTDFDENGHIVILVTKEINRMRSLADSSFSVTAFVSRCDLLFHAGCPPVSNGGEYFYAKAPDPAGIFGRPYPVDVALEEGPYIIAHELTHIIQTGRRIVHSGAEYWQARWESEGQAMLAMELLNHRVTGRRTGQNYGYDVIGRGETIERAQYRDNFVSLAIYFGLITRTTRVAEAPEQCSWLAFPSEGNDGPCMGNTALVYGVAWSFLRWVADQFGPSYPGGEPGLQRALIENRFAGFNTVADVVGVHKDSLLAQWAAMLYVDDRIPGVAPRLTLSSWNLYDVFSNFSEPARLTPRERAFSSFTDEVKVRAASTAYFRLSGAGRPATALGARDPAGPPLGSHMRLWVVRLQ